MTATSDGRPDPAQLGDANAWVYGPCWLWCGHRITDVLWIGPVIAPGHAEAGLYSCGPCLFCLYNMAWDYIDAATDAPTDEQGRPLPLYAPAGANPPRIQRRPGRQRRRPRTTFGTRLREAITGSPPVPKRPAPVEVRTR